MKKGAALLVGVWFSLAAGLQAGEALAQGPGPGRWPVEGVAKEGEFIVRIKRQSVTLEGLGPLMMAPPGGEVEGAEILAPQPLAGFATAMNADGLSLRMVSPDTLVLRFRGTDPDAGPGLAAVLGGEKANVENVREMIAGQFDLDPEEVTVTPNYVGYLAAAPNDPKWPLQWHHDLIGSLEAWQIRHDASDVVVAVLDSGIMLDHEDIAANLWSNPSPERANIGVTCSPTAWGKHGYDYLNCDPDPDAEFLPLQRLDRTDPNNAKCVVTGGGFFKRWETHGTQVAGVIGAVGDNNRGGTGLAWKIKIMAVKIGNGVCGSVDLGAVISGIEFAVRNGADIINASWAGFPDSALLRGAIEGAAKEGVLFVAAAGNGDLNGGINLEESPQYPAAYDIENIVVVGSVDREKRLSEFSNYGNEIIDILAPGENILSTSPRAYSKRRMSSYVQDNGTSFSAPLVAGVAALVMQGYEREARRRSLGEIRQRVIDGVDDNHPDDRARVSAGILNAAMTLEEQNTVLLSGGSSFSAVEVALADAFDQDLTSWQAKTYEEAFEEVYEALSGQGLEERFGSIDELAGDIAAQLTGKEPPTEISGEPAEVSGQVDAIVTLKAGVTKKQLEEILIEQGATLGRTVSERSRAFAISIPKGLDRDKILKDLGARPQFLEVTPNVKAWLQ